MKFKILTATSAEKLNTAIQEELKKSKATEILSSSIAVYNGLYYCLLFYRSAT